MASNVRPAAPEDVGRIWELIGELAEYERLTHLVSGSAEKLRGHLFGPDRMIYAFVAEDETGIVGYAIYFLNYSTFLTLPGVWLEDVYVTPSCRGKGMGKRLMEAVRDDSVRRGAGRMEWAVLDWNQPSIDFYRAFGADVLTEWHICRLTF